MKKVRKLTPETLKRIIAEEKQKLAKSRKKKRVNEGKSADIYVKYLKLLKEAKSKKSKDLLKIERARRILKSRLMKRL